MGVGEPLEKVIFKRGQKTVIAYPVISDAVVALRERIKDLLRKTLDEASLAEARKVRFGGEVTRKESEHWKERNPDPWVGVCVRKNGEELQDGILEQLREKYPHGLSLRATGLRMFWVGLSEKEPLGLTKVWEIPFSGVEPKGSGPMVLETEREIVELDRSAGLNPTPLEID